MIDEIVKELVRIHLRDVLIQVVNRFLLDSFEFFGILPPLDGFVELVAHQRQSNDRIEDLEVM